MAPHSSNLTSRPLIGMLIALILLLPASLQAADQDILFAATPFTFHTGPDKSSAKAGRLFTAARIKVRERRPGWLRISLNAWHQQGAARVLYALPGKRILVAILKKSQTQHLKTLQQMTDADTDLVWKQVSYEAWIEDGGFAPSREDLWKPAWELFSTRCTVCHQRRIPHHYKVNQWRSYLKIMGPRTGLPKDKQELILTFLQYHASDMTPESASPPQPVPQPREAGR